jgi:hypothetical protein
MHLRICDGISERKLPGTIEALEEAFGPRAPLRVGTELTLIDGERWLAAVALGELEEVSSEQSREFLLSGTSHDLNFPGPVDRDEALRHFREFVLAVVG